MKILTEAEGKSWLKGKNFPLDEIELKHFYKYSISHYLDKDSGVKTSLARGIVNAIREAGEEEGIFWITEWGIWPSSENQNLFYAYRKSLNEKREIGDAPFHIFEKSDLNDLECLLDLALYFIWTVIVICRNKKMVFIPNHDEYIDFCCESEKEFEMYKGLGLIKTLKTRTKDLRGNPV